MNDDNFATRNLGPVGSVLALATVVLFFMSIQVFGAIKALREQGPNAVVTWRSSRSSESHSERASDRLRNGIFCFLGGCACLVGVFISTGNDD